MVKLFLYPTFASDPRQDAGPFKELVKELLDWLEERPEGVVVTVRLSESNQGTPVVVFEATE